MLNLPGALPPLISIVINLIAGGTGINLQHASIIVQAEPWSDLNFGMEILNRCWRHGQVEAIKHCRLYATNSAADEEMLKLQESSEATISDFMAPLVTRFDAAPEWISVCSAKEIAEAKRLARTRESSGM